MSNALFGWPIWTDVDARWPAVTLSGGVWSATLPLTNVQDRRMSKVARTSGGNQPNRSRLLVDLASLRSPGVVALVCPTLSTPQNSQTGRARARCFSALPFDEWFGLSYLGPTVGVTGSGSFATADYISVGSVPCILDLVGDTDGAVKTDWNCTLNPGFTGNGTKTVHLQIRKGTISAASGTQITLMDGASARLDVTITWSGSVPTATFATGSQLSLTDLGDGVYDLSCQTTSVTAANSHVFHVFPAKTAAQQGNIYLGSIDWFNASVASVYYDSGWTSPYRLTSAVDKPPLGPVPVWFCAPGAAVVNTQYWGLGVYDTVATVHDFARLVIADGWQPTINISYGATIGLETETQRIVSDGGGALFNERPLRRTFTATLDNQADADMFTEFFQLQKQLGISRQFFFSFDPADTIYRDDRSFIATFRQLSALENPYLARWRGAFSLVEEI